MNRISRLRWWWRSAWGATLAGLGLHPARSQGPAYLWSRPGPPPDFSKIPRPAFLPPDDEVGVAAGVRAALVSDARQALSLVDYVGYLNGFEFKISYRSRDEVPREVFGMPAHHPHEHDLVVRIQYPDGGCGISADRGTDAMSAHYEAAYEGKEPPVPAGPVILPRSGGGGGMRYDLNYWCWPLPPDGPLNFTIEWPAVGIPSTTVEIDATAIRAAGLKSTRLWDG